MMSRGLNLAVSNAEGEAFTTAVDKARNAENEGAERCMVVVSGCDDEGDEHEKNVVQISRTEKDS
jgi:hypothetical protein